MNDYNVIVDSVAGVRKSLMEVLELDVKARVIRSVMKEDLSMSYRKILSVSWQAHLSGHGKALRRWALGGHGDVRVARCRNRAGGGGAVSTWA